MTKKAVVFNLGCKVNQYECDVISGALKERGFQVSDIMEKAEVFVINTCAVTAEAERKSRQIISRIRAKSPDAKIMITGCAGQKKRDFYLSKNVAYIGGTRGKTSLAERLNSFFAEDLTLPEIFEDTEIRPEVTRTRAYVKIQDGCDNFCSYCVIPYLRGRSRSRNPEAALKEINITAKSVGEIVITGINLAKYGLDIGTDLAELIGKIKDVPVRIRLGSFYVEGINEKLLDALFSLKYFCPQFHLSLQHGNTEVLRDMGRKYTPEEYKKALENIRARDIHASVTTDIIVGYPTETEETFSDSLRFIRDAGLSDIHIFPFSAREGTAAYSLKPHPPEVIKERKERLFAVKKELRQKYLNSLIGIPQRVLFEDSAGTLPSGYSEYYVKIYANNGTGLKTVIPTAIYKDGLKGDIK